VAHPLVALVADVAPTSSSCCPCVGASRSLHNDSSSYSAGGSEQVRKGTSSMRHGRALVPVRGPGKPYTQISYCDDSAGLPRAPARSSYRRRVAIVTAPCIRASSHCPLKADPKITRLFLPEKSRKYQRNLPYCLENRGRFLAIM